VRQRSLRSCRLDDVCASDNPNPSLGHTSFKAIGSSASNASCVWRPRSPAPARGSSLGGFLLPGGVKFEARVAPLELAHPLASFDSRILASIPRKRRFFGPFLGFVLSSFASKTSSFLAFQKAKSFVCTRSVGSFRRITSFYHFPAFFPLARSISPYLAAACRRPPTTTLIGYYRSLLVSREKCRGQKGSCQASGVGSRGRGKVRTFMGHYTRSGKLQLAGCDMASGDGHDGGIVPLKRRAALYASRPRFHESDVDSEISCKIVGSRGGMMATEANEEDVFFGPEAIRTSVLLNCLCDKTDVDWMEVKDATCGSGLPTNAVMALIYECRSCHRRVAVHFVVEAPKPEPA